MPAISVVVPLYNKARHVKRALRSVERQTLAPEETVVVDDGSTDGSGLIVERMGLRRTRLLQVPHGGSAQARNLGVRATGSSLIAFLDADDEWRPGFLETTHGLLCKWKEAAAAGIAYQLCHPSGRLHMPRFRMPPEANAGCLFDYFRAVAGPPPVTMSSTLVRRDALEAVGLFPAGLQRGSDLVMWTRLALRYPMAFQSTPQAIYHLDSDNRICQTVFLAHKHSVVHEIDLALERESDPVRRRDLHYYRARLTLDVAWQNLLAGRPATAVKILDEYPMPVRLARLKWQFRIMALAPDGWLPGLWNLKLRWDSRRAGGRAPQYR